MREGITLAALAAEIRRQAQSKEDFILDTRHLALADSGDRPMLNIAGHGTLPVQLNAHRQVGDRLKIPAAYYDRLLADAPDLLVQNVNHWLRQTPETRMVRTLDGEVRAYLSDRYRPLEHCDLAEAVLPALADAGAVVHSCQVTPPRLVHQGGDRVSTGDHPPTRRSQRAGLPRRDGVPRDRSLQLRGSGAEPCRFSPRSTPSSAPTWRFGPNTPCGGSTWAPSLANDSDQVSRYLSDETRRLSDAALWSQVRDITCRTLRERCSRR